MNKFKIKESESSPTSSIRGFRRISDSFGKTTVGPTILSDSVSKHRRVLRTIFNFQSATRNPQSTIGKGFTLTEILLVAVILSIVGLSVYSAFSNGIKVWKRIVQNIPQEDVNIFFEKIAHDLRNSFQYAGIKFEGTEEKIAFPALITFRGPEGLEDGLGRVIYSLDNLTNSINREQVNYSQLYQGITPSAYKLVGNIETLTFQYYYYDPEAKRYYWKNVWEKEENLPLAVKVKVEFYENEKKTNFIETISIPVCKVLTTSEEK